MNQELLTHAIKMFDSFDKWNSFIELSNLRGEIRVRYFEKLKIGLNKHFINDTNDFWSFKPIINEQYRWHLKAFGAESICLLWRVQDLILWCNPAIVNAQLAKDLLNTPEFNSLFNCFDNTDTLSNPNLHHFCEEKHRYTFGESLSYSGPDEENHEKLSWFAGNRTQEMVDQISEKVNRFRTPANTELLTELNKRCKTEQV